MIIFHTLLVILSTYIKKYAKLLRFREFFWHIVWLCRCLGWGVREKSVFFIKLQISRNLLTQPLHRIEKKRKNQCPILKMFHFYFYSINQSRIVQFEFWRFFHRSRGAPVWWWPSGGRQMKHSPKFDLYNASLAYTVEIKKKHLYRFQCLKLIHMEYSCREKSSESHEIYLYYIQKVH